MRANIIWSAVLAAGMATASLAAAGEAKRRAPHFYGEPTPVPEGARVILELDKEAYFLGENLLVHYVLENTGDAPFKISMGSDYRGASRALRFKVSATGADGKTVPDPDPSGFCMGGMGWTPTVKPGEKYIASLALTRYCRFEKPGVYTLRVRHDLGWKETKERRIPVGETTIKLVMPTEKQAREVVEEMYRLPTDPGAVSGQRTRPYADFTALWHPVYLPILLERAENACEKALRAIGCMPTPEGTKALIGLLGHKERSFVLKVAGTLNCRLPDPEFKGKIGPRSPFRGGLYDRRRWLAQKSWRPEFAKPILARARELLAWHGDQSMAYAAFMLQCLGGKDDLPHLIDALDHAVPRTKGAPRETRVYPPPRGACRELLRAARMLVQRGAEIPADPKTPGQAVVFLVALRLRKDFRPQGWEATYARLLQHEIPYVQEIALESVPEPPPKALVELLRTRLAHPDLDVRIAACRAAGESKSPELRAPVLKLVASAEDHWLLNAATNAAHQLGARVETLGILASRLDSTEIGWECFYTLMSWVIVSHDSGGKSVLDAETARRLKARWTKFLQDHREALKAGRRFKPGDPELTPDLMPPEYKIHLKNGKDWP